MLQVTYGVRVFLYSKEKQEFIIFTFFPVRQYGKENYRHTGQKSSGPARTLECSIHSIGELSQHKKKFFSFLSSEKKYFQHIEIYF